MVSCLGCLFSRAAGREGRCRQMSLVCVGSTRSVRPHWVCPRLQKRVLSPSTLLRLLAALYGAGPVLSAVPVFGSSSRARIRLHLRFVSSPTSAVQAARGLGALSPDAACLFPPWPQRAPLVGSQEVFKIGTGGLFAVWEGVASLGLSLPLSPPPCLLPPVGMGRLFSGVSQSLCFANRRRCVPAG